MYHSITGKFFTEIELWGILELCTLNKHANQSLFAQRRFLQVTRDSKTNRVLNLKRNRFINLKDVSTEQTSFVSASTEVYTSRVWVRLLGRLKESVK